MENEKYREEIGNMVRACVKPCGNKTIDGEHYVTYIFLESLIDKFVEYTEKLIQEIREEERYDFEILVNTILGKYKKAKPKSMQNKTESMQKDIKN